MKSFGNTFLHPERPTSLVEIASEQRIGYRLGIECWWPPTNEEPMFRCTIDRRTDSNISVRDLPWFERNLGKLYEEWTGDIPTGRRT